MSDFGKFLTGTVLAQAKLDKVVVTIADVRTTSYGREVIDFEQSVAEDYSSLPLNQTNALRLRRLFGRDRDGWINQCIELARYHVPNPKTGELTHGIYVDDGTGPPDISQFASKQGQPAKAPAKVPAKVPAKLPMTAPDGDRTPQPLQVLAEPARRRRS